GSCRLDSPAVLAPPIPQWGPSAAGGWAPSPAPPVGLTMGTPDRRKQMSPASEGTPSSLLTTSDIGRRTLSRER
ncbi:MAG: hypothetical protein ACE5MG_02310, partial [Candidatus Methylomirabilales bacterium]